MCINKVETGNSGWQWNYLPNVSKKSCLLADICGLFVLNRYTLLYLEFVLRPLAVNNVWCGTSDSRITVWETLL